MRRTGFLYDERFLLHKTGDEHPESPERLLAAWRGVEEGGLLPRLVRLEAKRARQEEIEAVHSIKYIMRFEEECLLGMPYFMHPDNQMCRQTYEAAMLAVGGVTDCVDRVMAGELDNAFCAVRPPGHHAEVNRAMGFCFFNNVAIAARYLQSKWDVKRIGIIDFDVHHGNGTQQIFEDDDSVYYYSIHEHPSFAYPGTGREFEKGTGPGFGFTLNTPMLPGQGDSEYRECLERDLVPAFDLFRPEVILLSAGFDAHVDDDMSDINVSTKGFSWMMQQFMKLADFHAEGRIISILEGGYCLTRLPELIRNHVSLLLEMEAT
ncbi:MAG TPA: histone deacetylase [Dissulfurispiraceae bacterium]|nr:histone deacetylase [Dissulfurispiraceae bacterium]